MDRLTKEEEDHNLQAFRSFQAAAKRKRESVPPAASTSSSSSTSTKRTKCSEWWGDDGPPTSDDDEIKSVASSATSSDTTEEEDPVGVDVQVREEAFTLNAKYPLSVVTQLLTYLPHDDPSLDGLRMLEGVYGGQEENDGMIRLEVAYHYYKGRTAGRATGSSKHQNKNGEFRTRTTPHMAFPKDVRAWLARDLYYDVDIAGSSTTCLVRWFRRNGVEVPWRLQRLVTKREAMLLKVHDNRDHAKRLVNTALCGGNVGFNPFLHSLQEDVFATIRHHYYNGMPSKEFRADWMHAQHHPDKEPKMGKLVATIIGREEMELVRALMVVCAAHNIDVGAYVYDGLLVDQEGVKKAFGSPAKFMVFLQTKEEFLVYKTPIWAVKPWVDKPTPSAKTMWEVSGATVHEYPDEGVVRPYVIPINETSKPKVMCVQASMGSQKTRLYVEFANQNREQCDPMLVCTPRVTLSKKQKNEFSSTHYKDLGLYSVEGMKRLVITPQSINRINLENIPVGYFKTVLIDEVRTLIAGMVATKINRTMTASHAMLKIILRQAKQVILLDAELSIDRCVLDWLDEFLPPSDRTSVDVHIYGAGLVTHMVRRIVSVDDRELAMSIVDDVIHRRTIAIACTSKSAAETWQRTFNNWVKGEDIRSCFMSEEAMDMHDAKLKKNERQRYWKAFEGFQIRLYCNDIRDSNGAGNVTDWDSEKMKSLINGTGPDGRVHVFIYTSKCDVGLSCNERIHRVYGIAAGGGPSARSFEQMLARFRKVEVPTILVSWANSTGGSKRVLYRESLEKLRRRALALRSHTKDHLEGYIAQYTNGTYVPVNNVMKWAPDALTRIAAYVQREHDTPFYQYFCQVATMSSGWILGGPVQKKTTIPKKVLKKINQEHVNAHLDDLANSIQVDWEEGVMTSVYTRLQHTWTVLLNDHVTRLDPLDMSQRLTRAVEKEAEMQLHTIRRELDPPNVDRLHALALTTLHNYTNDENDEKPELPITSDQLPHAIGFYVAIRKLAYWNRFSTEYMKGAHLRDLLQTENIDMHSKSKLFRQVVALRQVCELIHGSPDQLITVSEEKLQCEIDNKKKKERSPFIKYDITPKLAQHTEKIEAIYDAVENGWDPPSSTGALRKRKKKKVWAMDLSMSEDPATRSIAILKHMLSTIFGKHKFCSKIPALFIESNRVKVGKKSKITTRRVAIMPHLMDLAGMTEYFVRSSEITINTILDDPGRAKLIGLKRTDDE